MKKAWLMAVLAVGTARAQPTPMAEIKPAEGSFIDDALALRADGGAVAYVTTDGSAHAVLHLHELRPPADQAVPLASGEVAALAWVGRARVLVIFRGAEESRFAQVYGPGGAERVRLGPVDRVAVHELEGIAAVVTYTRSDKARAVEHQVAAYRADTLAPLARRAWREDKDGLIAHPGGSLKPLWWEAGLTSLAVLKAGSYDKARDVQRPNRFARLDLFGGQIRDEQEIGDIMAFAHVTLDHTRHVAEARFAHVSDDRAHLVVIDGLDEHELKLERPLSMYEPDTLRWQALEGGRLALSLTVDPMNPAALERKKADPDRISVYVVDARAREAAPRVILDGKGRPSSWTAGGGKLALLRKSKGFERGGAWLEIYDLP
jgi:hypothetical protein